MENDIKFPTNMLFSEDLPFCFYCLCLAKNFIITPYVFYIYRPRKGSATRENLSIEEQIHKYVNAIITGTQILDCFMSKLNFFEQNKKFKFIAIDFFIKYHLNTYLDKFYFNNPIYDIDLLIRKEILSYFDEHSPLMSYFFNMSNFYRLNFNSQQKQILNLKQQINNLTNGS